MRCSSLANVSPVTGKEILVSTKRLEDSSKLIDATFQSLENKKVSGLIDDVESTWIDTALITSSQPTSYSTTDCAKDPEEMLSILL